MSEDALAQNPHIQSQVEELMKLQGYRQIKGVVIAVTE